jgi:hypothetical protein
MRQAPPVRNHAPLPNAGCCSESSTRLSQWMEVENYAVATSQIAEPHCARCWAGLAALIAMR